MKSKLLLFLCFVNGLVLFAKPHTPAPGSSERKAICDAMREFVVSQYKKPAASSILFKIEFLRVEEDYAAFEGFPVNSDGSPLPEGLLGDIVFTTFLQRIQGNWRVVFDLTRSDVPSSNEVQQLRKKIPPTFPTSVMPDFWKKLLRP